MQNSQFMANKLAVSKNPMSPVTEIGPRVELRGVV